MQTSLFFCFLFLLVAFVIADREFEYDDDGNDKKIRLETSAETETTEGSLDFECEGTISEGLRVRFEYEHEVELMGTESEYEIKFELEFEELIEFEAADATLGYQQTDTILQTVQFSNGFDAWVYTTEIVNDVKKHVFTTSSVAVSGFTMDVTATVTEGDLLDATLFNQNAIKIDLQFNNFNFLSSTSVIAVKSEVKFETSVEEEDDDDSDSSDDDDDDEDEIKVTAVNADPTKPSAYFAWITTAETDDAKVVDIVASSFASGDDKIMYFTFVGDYHSSAYILWDPEMGLTPGTPKNDIEWKYVGPAIGGGVLLLGAATAFFMKSSSASASERKEKIVMAKPAFDNL